MYIIYYIAYYLMGQIKETNPWKESYLNPKKDT